MLGLVFVMIIMLRFFFLFNLRSIFLISNFFIAFGAFSSRWDLLHAYINRGETVGIGVRDVGRWLSCWFGLRDRLENGFDLLVFIFKSFDPLKQGLEGGVDVSLQLLWVHFKSISNYYLNSLP